MVQPLLRAAFAGGALDDDAGFMLLALPAQLAHKPASAHPPDICLQLGEREEEFVVQFQLMVAVA